MSNERRLDGPDVVPTGVPGLDVLLHGGFARRACVLVEGPPGSGKTTLGLQFIHDGIVSHDEPGVIITFEELPEDLYRDAAAYGWDLPALEREGRLAVICTSPEVFEEDTLSTGGFFERTVLELQPTRVVIDSITQMQQVSDDPVQQRKLVYGLRNCFKRHDLTALMTREVDTPIAGPAFEKYVADTVIGLDYRPVPEVGLRVREVEVTKTRMRPHTPGRHPIEITSQGMVVVPALAPPSAEAAVEEDVALQFVPTGCEGLDAMLGGGLVRGSTTIVAGSTGVGKTVLGLQFLAEGLRQGEPGLLVCFEQTPTEIRRVAAGLGLPHEQMGPGAPIDVHHRRPGRRPLGLLVAEAVEKVRAARPGRLVIDAISTLAKSALSGNSYRSDLAAMLANIRAMEVTTLVLDETPGIVSELEVTGGVMISSLVDNILVMRYVELESEMRRAVSVLKARYVDHDKEIREYVIGPGGLALREKFQVTTGLFRGAPQRGTVEDFF